MSKKERNQLHECQIYLKVRAEPASLSKTSGLFRESTERMEIYRLARFCMFECIFLVSFTVLTFFPFIKGFIYQTLGPAELAAAAAQAGLSPSPQELFVSESVFILNLY